MKVITQIHYFFLIQKKGEAFPVYITFSTIHEWSFFSYEYDHRGRMTNSIRYSSIEEFFKSLNEFKKEEVYDLGSVTITISPTGNVTSERKEKHKLL